MLGSSRVQAIICAVRMPEAAHFYSEVLGLRLIGHSLGALVYDVGGTSVRVSPVPSLTPSEHTVLGFAVPALEPVAAALLARGVEPARFPGFDHDERGIVRAPDGTRVLWMRDPEGNILSVVQFA
jgi:catechol 2,3-dioxygenase-like lactoylglutathione lyase family enzyme